MECHVWCRPILCTNPGPGWHATPDVVWPSMQSKDFYDIPCVTSPVRVCILRAIMTSHTLLHPTVCVVQGIWWEAMPDVVQPCVLSKGNDVGTPDILRLCMLSKRYLGMPHSTLPDRVCSERAIMVFHTRCRLPMCNVQGTWCHDTSDVVLLCVICKGDDGMPCLTSSVSAWCPRAMIACHTWCREAVCVVQGR